MARTKQTPRNPNLERPSAAMVVMYKKEEHLQNLHSKHITTKGGKQPCKHMLHKLPQMKYNYWWN